MVIGIRIDVGQQRERHRLVGTDGTFRRAGALAVPGVERVNIVPGRIVSAPLHFPIAGDGAERRGVGQHAEAERKRPRQFAGHGNRHGPRGIFRIPARSPQHTGVITVRGQAGRRHIAGSGQRDARPVIEQESVLRLVDLAADTVVDVALDEFDQVYERLESGQIGGGSLHDGQLHALRLVPQLHAHLPRPRNAVAGILGERKGHAPVADTLRGLDRDPGSRIAIGPRGNHRPVAVALDIERADVAVPGDVVQHHLRGNRNIRLAPGHIVFIFTSGQQHSGDHRCCRKDTYKITFHENLFFN